MRQFRLRLCRSMSGDMSAWQFNVTPFQSPVKGHEVAVVGGSKRRRLRSYRGRQGLRVYFGLRP